jgi:hypothetical protein
MTGVTLGYLRRDLYLYPCRPLPVKMSLRSSKTDDLKLVLKLAGMRINTRTRTRAYPCYLPAGVSIPLSFTSNGSTLDNLLINGSDLGNVEDESLLSARGLGQEMAEMFHGLKQVLGGCCLCSTSSSAVINNGVEILVSRGREVSFV